MTSIHFPVKTQLERGKAETDMNVEGDEAGFGADLQDEDEVVNGLVAVEEVVLGLLLVLVVELELLDDRRMLEEPQQDLLRHLSRTKGIHLYREGMKRRHQETESRREG